MKLIYLSLALAPALASATNTESVDAKLVYDQGGYTQVVIDSNFEQKYPLLQVTSLEFPTSVKYVGQALNYALALSGYQLESTRDSDYTTLRLYAKKLPLVNRSFTRSTVKQIVEVIVGHGYDININEKSRTIRIVKQAS
ncbi:hypothetical protein VTH8203_01346 [Vibrio thalassae]|uniref:Toxin co-regulated pilus biosynthesis protein Q n=1 Tax=Vibrio thalassae TaxID=1243014 RepID=A0A240EGT6_9VIBR|nr:hypothetical protein [Vibrio thalassae]SNX47731.1 hypothetical protein VTH8203_01346 [Vibrio thalassae]